MKAETPTADDLKKWETLGGKQVMEKKRAVFIAPSGDKLKSWSEAAVIISQQKKETEKVDKKRGKENAAASPASKKTKAPATAGEKKADVKEEEEARDVGSGRIAAQGKEYKDKALRTTRDQYIVVEEEEEVESEALAFEQTASEKGGAKRRLMQFSAEVEGGQLLAIDRVSISPSPVHLTGIVYPEEGPVSKSKGRKVAQRFGPVKEWKVVYAGDNASIVLKTATAIYEVSKPAHKYKATFAELLEQLEICKVVYSTLGPEGGNMQSSMEDVLAKMTRAKIGRNYGSAKDALILNGKFVLTQLKSMTAQCASSGKSLGKGVTFEDSIFGKALAEVAKGPLVTSVMTNGIRILDTEAPAPAAPAAVDAMMEADEEFARKLQAKISAQANGGGGGRAKNAPSSAIIRISPEEIADDYPLPMQYEKEEEETDEYLYAEDDLLGADPMHLPKKILHDFSFYNSEGFLSTLELVPTEDGYNHDVDVYASGTVAEDDGTWMEGGGAQQEAAGGSGGAGGSSSSAAAAGGAAAVEPKKAEGMRVFLSEIKSWHVEVGFDSLSFTITTEVAVYRLGSPSVKYAPWFKTVTTAVKAAVMALGLISNETRAARLSFADVAKKISELPEIDPSFISKKIPWVERFLIVHGQIILSQFKHYPVKVVCKSAFVSELKDKMEVRKHSKLYQSKGKSKAVVKVKNSNPMKNRAAVGLKAKPMNATATTLVKAVWQGYFIGSRKKDEEAVEGAPVAKEVEEDANEEEEEEDGVENALAGPSNGASKAAKKKDGASASSSSRVKANKLTPKFTSAAISIDSSSRTLYRSAKLGDLDITLGQIVELHDSSIVESEVQVTTLGLVTALFADKAGKAMIQVRKMIRAPDTVLGDAGREWDLLMTEDLEDWELDSDVVGVIEAVCTAQRPWEWDLRRKHFQEDEAIRKKNDEERASGGSLFKYVYCHLYKPDDGMFAIIPESMVKVTGSYLEPSPEPAELSHSSDGKGIILKGTEYRIGDFVYLDPYTFTRDGGSAAAKKKKKAAAKKKRSRKDEEDEDDEDEEDEQEEEAEDQKIEDVEEEEAEKAPAYSRKSGKHKGSNAGLKAFLIAQITSIATKPSSVKIRRFYRPEDVSRDHAYSTEWWEVYAGPDTEHSVNDFDKILKKCSVRLGGNKPGRFFEDEFICTGSFDPSKSSSGASSSSSSSSGVTAPPKTLLRDAAPSKTKVKPTESTKLENALQEPESTVSMRSMDIFAGCGGLSEGMHQAGVATSHWAIEYEPSAAEAFRLNNPDAATFCNNCNVLLRAAMEKAGQADDCDACDDAMEAAARLDPAERDKLPPPGDVEFIMGGPPCQGYSGMNRFNKSNWSLVQNSMVMAYLSYCEFYRPRYFLLENVRNFVSHNKSFTFRLTLSTLLEMGYQVRFGVLNAGNYGVPQSRKRTIIWAAAPGEYLPKWPTPSHVFHSPQLTINLPGGVQYTAVPNQIGAPLRAVTVKDAIFDLPAISNGHQKDPIDHPAEKRVSAYQKFIQGGAGSKITDHICKEMNELNLERCKCIPKNQPGADWRVLQEIVAADPTREKFNGQPLVPWCLPNTADRHNGWRGLFGRLDANGHFPTSTTDPQPMGKVGQVFHPEQDRIVSVRECARSQGFPDHFKFAGNVHSRHRQVGNAVPPPLAAALGRCLRSVLEQKKAEDIAEREAAMGL